MNKRLIFLTEGYLTNFFQKNLKNSQKTNWYGEEEPS